MKFEPVETDGVRGEVLSAWRAAVERWIRGELKDEVRVHRDSRSVRTIESGGKRLYIKIFLDDPGVIGRILPRGRIRARREFDNIVEAAERGVPVPQPVGFLRDKSRGIVLTAEFGDAVRLDEALRGAPFRERTDLIHRTGAFLRTLISTGVIHGDLHFGNILVRGRSLCLTDMHDVRIVKGPLRGRTAWTLAASLLGSLNWTVSTSEGVRLIKAAGFNRHDEWREIHDALRADRMRYVRSRARHSLREGAGYRRAEVDGWKIVAIPEGSRDLAARWLKEPTLLSFKSEARARQYWVRGIQTHYSAVPCLHMEMLATRGGAAKIRLQDQPGAVPLADWIRNRWPGLPFEGRCKALARFAFFLRNAHERGVSGIRKVLVQERLDRSWNLTVADYEEVQVSRRVALAARWADLAAFEHAAAERLSRAELRRALRMYWRKIPPRGRRATLKRTRSGS